MFSERMEAMINYTIQLKSLDDIYEFVKKCNQLDCDIDLICGRCTVDAKSLLGVISLDIRRSLRLVLNTTNAFLAEQIMAPYIAA